jgi:hypothetical protein
VDAKALDCVEAAKVDNGAAVVRRDAADPVPPLRTANGSPASRVSASGFGHLPGLLRQDRDDHDQRSETGKPG